MSRPPLDPLGDVPPALHSASAELAARAGVAVLGPWVRVSTPRGTRWGLPVRLCRAGDASTGVIAPETDWSVTVASDGDVRLYPSPGDGGLRATFPHQNYNGDAVSAGAGWDVRAGEVCVVSSTHALAQSRAAEYDEPADLFDRVLWHVERALEWLARAAAGDLVRPGDPFELPDFKTPGYRAGTLAVYEDRQSLEQ